jgi:hypothetical protein
MTSGASGISVSCRKREVGECVGLVGNSVGEKLDVEVKSRVHRRRKRGSVGAPNLRRGDWASVSERGRDGTIEGNGGSVSRGPSWSSERRGKKK